MLRYERTNSIAQYLLRNENILETVLDTWGRGNGWGWSAIGSAHVLAQLICLSSKWNEKQAIVKRYGDDPIVWIQNGLMVKLPVSHLISSNKLRTTQRNRLCLHFNLNKLLSFVSVDGMRSCFHCGKNTPPIKIFRAEDGEVIVQKEHGKTCGQCGLPTYCNKRCQRKDWKHHRHVCRIIDA